MANLDKIAKDKSKKKQKGGLASAVSSTEKIRTWVWIIRDDLISPIDRTYDRARVTRLAARHSHEGETRSNRISRSNRSKSFSNPKSCRS